MQSALAEGADVVGFVPKEMFFTKGVGKHREKLTSFELALRSAGIAACNLVRVSSIFPPGCRLLSRTQGAKRLEPGQVTFVVMSEAATREPHRLVAATVGVAIPRDRELYGYLSEHHSFGESEEVAGDYAEELAAEMLATTLGLEFDPGQELGREERSLPPVQPDRPHPERHANSRRRQEGLVDHRRGRRRARRLTRASTQTHAQTPLRLRPYGQSPCVRSLRAARLLRRRCRPRADH